MRAAKRSRPSAALEAPDGIGESSKILAPGDERLVVVGGVEKKPPRSGSPKRATIVSARARASTNQRSSKVAS